MLIIIQLDSFILIAINDLLFLLDIDHKFIYNKLFERKSSRNASFAIVAWLLDLPNRAQWAAMTTI